MLRQCSRPNRPAVPMSRVGLLLAILLLIPLWGFSQGAGSAAAPQSVGQDASLDPASQAAGTTRYEIQLGYFGSSDSVRQAREEAERRGLKPLFIVEAGAGYRLRYGPFPDPLTADRARAAIQGKGYEDAWIEARRTPSAPGTPAGSEAEPSPPVRAAPEAQRETSPAYAIALASNRSEPRDSTPTRVPDSHPVEPAVDREPDREALGSEEARPIEDSIQPAIAQSDPEDEPQPQPPTRAQAKKESPGGRPEHAQLVTNVFYETSLRDALADIAAQTHTIIVPDMSVQGIVTCELADVPLERALRIVLSVGGFIFRDMGDYILVGSPDPESPSFSTLCETSTLRLEYVNAKQAAELLPKPMRKYTTVNAEINTVGIMAPPSLMAQILSQLERLDCAPRQLMLDARIVVMENGDLTSLGLQWEWPVASAGIFSNAEQHTDGEISWPWGFQVGYTPDKEFTNSLLATLNLLSQNDEATVIANPQVMVQDGEEAEISVTTEEYFEILTEGYYTRSELEKIEAGTVLKITPRLVRHNDIRLKIAAEVSDVVARGKDNLPVVTRRLATSTVRVQDGGTAVVAGLVDNRTRVNTEHVPGFSQVPLFGNFFRNTSDRVISRQVAVFVTPRLIPEGESLLERISPEPVDIQPAGREFRSELIKALADWDPTGERP